ncbi:MAG: Rieske (2Fe-2S) protein [Actinomycetota bacterium]
MIDRTGRARRRRDPPDHRGRPLLARLGRARRLVNTWSRSRLNRRTLARCRRTISDGSFIEARDPSGNRGAGTGRLDGPCGSRSRRDIGGSRSVTPEGGDDEGAPDLHGGHRAFLNICMHHGGSLKLDGGTFTCEWHGSTFDARTGKALSGPVRPDARLIMLPTRVEDGVLTYVYEERSES